MIDYAIEIPGIYSMPLYDADACTAMIDYARRMNAWTQAIVSVRDDEQRFTSVVNQKTRLASAFTPEADSTIMKDFDARMNDTVKPLVRRLWSVHLTEHTGTHMVRYVPGNYYAAHNDTGLNLLDRYFSVVCYLNDDFRGGHTSFPCLGHSVAPERGKAIVFPATYTHCAEPISAGEKYVFVSWLKGSVPVSWI